MKQLWAKLRDRLRFSRPRSHLHWHRIADAKQSEFFRWFSFVEDETVKNREGNTVVRFRPAGEKFRRLVRLDAERAAMPEPDAGGVAMLANEIERRHRFPVISLQPSPQPVLPAMATPGFQVFIGQRRRFETVCSMSRLKIEQTSTEDRAAVQITIQFSRN